MKIIEAVNFIRSKGILTQWTNEQIAYGIKCAIKESAATWTVDAEGNLTGIVFGKWEENGTLFHVTCLAGEGSPSVFFRYLRNTFPQCTSVKMGRIKYGGKMRTYKLLK
jgi:hypothetical protein